MRRTIGSGRGASTGATTARVRWWRISSPHRLGWAAMPNCSSASRRCCAIVLVLCADGSATALRNLFHRIRPCHVLTGVRLLVGCTDSFSFPSNSAANVFALAAVVAVFHRKLAVPAFVTAAVVGCSRVYVGVHYPLDVFAGAWLGIAWGLAGATIIKRAFLRNRAG
jgi:membrane-associated phospholipid phosphatase